MTRQNIPNNETNYVNELRTQVDCYRNKVMNFVNELESVKRVIGAINDMSTANEDVKALHDHIERSS